MSLKYSVWIAPTCWLLVWKGLKPNTPEVWSSWWGGISRGTTSACRGEDSDFRGYSSRVSRGLEPQGAGSCWCPVGYSHSPLVTVMSYSPILPEGAARWFRKVACFTCLLKNKTWPLGRVRALMWQNWPLSCNFLCLCNLALQFVLAHLSGSLRGSEDGNLKGENDLHFFRLQLKSVYWLNSQTSNRSAGPRAQAVWQGCTFFGGDSNDTFGLALLPDDGDEMSWLPHWFLSHEQHKLLTREPCCIGFRDLCPKPVVKVLSHGRRVIASFLGWDLEVPLLCSLHEEQVFSGRSLWLGLGRKNYVLVEAWSGLRVCMDFAWVPSLLSRKRGRNGTGSGFHFAPLPPTDAERAHRRECVLCILPCLRVPGAYIVFLWHQESQWAEGTDYRVNFQDPLPEAPRLNILLGLECVGRAGPPLDTLRNALSVSWWRGCWNLRGKHIAFQTFLLQPLDCIPWFF